MPEQSIPDLRHHLEALSSDIQHIRQNRLLDEGQFIGFAKERGIPTWGIGTGDPGDFHERGWLPADADGNRKPLFHPFRIYPLHLILSECELNITPSSTLRRDRMVGFVQQVLEGLPSLEQIGEAARGASAVTDLAVILEPLYWPRITGWTSRPGGVSQEEYEACLDEYRPKVLGLVRTLDLDLWHRVHGKLVMDAGWLDRNDHLYLLLRLASWDERRRVTGRIGGSLWLRHMGEVIRGGFEEAHGVEWQEEDQAFGTWPPHARKRAYGSERPLDDELHSRPYLAFYFGLTTGSVVRWYVEGDTEYYCVLQILGEPAKYGIELVNLRGALQTGRDNAALKLRDWLQEDRAHRRFSILSFDTDVGENVKAVRRQAEQDNIVGYIGTHQPDFEFANFTVEELAEVAARIDEAHHADGSLVRGADWRGVSGGREFEARYRAVSARRPRGLKGEEWGRALADYASEHPNRANDANPRPLWVEFEAALSARIANYDLQKVSLGFDRETLALVDRHDQADRSLA